MWKYLLTIPLLLSACAANAPVAGPIELDPYREVVELSDAICVTAKTHRGIIFECIHRNGQWYRMIAGEEV
jgi:hypothetical protein